MLRFGVVVLALLIARPALAQYPPITSRDFAIDLYDGAAIGNTDMVGMGGAGTALVLGTPGQLLNPSAIAIRQTTDNDRWGLLYHVDVLTGQYSSDYDNNGQVASGGAQLYTFGVGLRIGNWAGGFTTIYQAADVTGSSLAAKALRLRYALAVWIPEADLSIGGGLQQAAFRIDPETGPTLFSMSGTGLIAGATYVPHDEDFRVGAAVDASIDGGQIDADSDCDPSDCMGYILPDQVRAPWRVSGGIAYRLGPTPWNQQVATPFRDERALTLAADVVVNGATENGYGIEAFGMHQLQPSGRQRTIGVRGGAVYELKPGRLRVRGGSYWEPGRFEGIGGRAHATFGIDLRLLQFKLFGQRRGRISVTGDLADRYTNFVFDIGFWH